MTSSCLVFLFFFDDVTASTDVSTLSLHDALPISQAFEPAFFLDFDEIDFRAVLAHCIDFDLRRARRHHHRATFSEQRAGVDRKSTRLNSSHLGISYAVFCLKKTTKLRMTYTQRNL